MSIESCAKFTNEHPPIFSSSCKISLWNYVHILSHVKVLITQSACLFLSVFVSLLYYAPYIGLIIDFSLTTCNISPSNLAKDHSGTLTLEFRTDYLLTDTLKHHAKTPFIKVYPHPAVLLMLPYAISSVCETYYQPLWCPGRATGQLLVSVCVRVCPDMIAFKWNDLWPTYVAR